MHLESYNENFSKILQDYYLKDPTYTALPKDVIALERVGQSLLPILLIDNEVIVSFCALDQSDDKFQFTDNENSILLRSFSTDSRYEGRGYAKELIKRVISYVKQAFPHVDEVVLGVNVKNHSAKHLYVKCGFEDTGRYVLGEVGYQHVYRLKLKS
ncbi:GNAT family N-acetyltransferase [Staphylococcus massiliensis]|uniref:N-acetyltransferase domain-containing protein n=1 Tax=Staphylococcus massiliensis S46 TaxID=1229783 RepID=K9B9N5_9STAP|nr:GNAT family N-acetyltransferase [Staphylococcus massiliensis]EKU50445.1 hypothetical protein C273_00440 [Staphylococcus massiliensis S46]MCG3398785.1 GNAT family N-acetyltransferase [Staphylococcus massiliensis]MCG3411872.1 GNAT family N-acetyltransferase [Staphylococcus massiliensis]POA00480.1 GNAT family N-acetyltransferase [Staphylococcus massiliensis CCUG 55927]